MIAYPEAVTTEAEPDEDPAGRAQRGVAAMLTADAASANAGITVEVPGPGQAQARMVVTDAMLNGHGTCHGGYLFLLADTAFACACNTHDFMTFAAAASIVFVAPAHAGDVLTASAAERARYGRSGVYDITVTRGADVIAEFRGQSRMTGVPLLGG